MSRDCRADFATVVDGVTSDAPADQTTFVEFDLATDGSAFVVSPGQPDQIESATNMTPAFIDRPDEFENMRSQGADGDVRSRLVARVIRNGNGEITEAADIWVNGNTATRQASSGYFAWGNALSRPDLDFLQSSGAAANFTGRMSVDNQTVANVTVNFGSATSWTGSWTNPSYTFDAGGAFVGVDMLSDSSQFSSNVQSGSAIRGALLGQRDAKSIAHIIEINLAGVGLIRDVGLLRE